MQASDETILETIARDPPEGIRMVIEVHGPALLGRVRNRARTCKFGDAHVDDIFQEAILSLIDPDTRQGIRAAGGGILPWLTRRCYWRLQDEHRRYARSLTHQDRVSVRDGEPSEGALAVERLLPEMSERDQRILRQHYGEDMTYVQIADAERISKAAAKKAIHDAKARLRERLVDAGYGPTEAENGRLD